MENFMAATLPTTLPFPIVAPDVSADRELTSAFKQGDVEAFNCLALKYGDRVYRHCLRIVRDPEESSDLTQEVFLKVFRSFDKYDHRNAFGGWLYRMTANTCIDYLRKKKRGIQTASLKYEQEQDGETEYGAVKFETPEWAATNSELMRILGHAVNELPEKLRAVFILREYEGYTHREITQMLGCSKGTIKTQLRRARNRLMESLTPSLAT